MPLGHPELRESYTSSADKKSSLKPWISETPTPLTALKSTETLRPKHLVTLKKPRAFKSDNKEYVFTVKTRYEPNNTFNQIMKLCRATMGKTMPQFWSRSGSVRPDAALSTYDPQLVQLLDKLRILPERTKTITNGRSENQSPFSPKNNNFRTAGIRPLIACPRNKSVPRIGGDYKRNKILWKRKVTLGLRGISTSKNPSLRESQIAFREPTFHSRTCENSYEEEEERITRYFLNKRASIEPDAPSSFKEPKKPVAHQPINKMPIIANLSAGITVRKKENTGEYVIKKVPKESKGRVIFPKFKILTRRINAGTGTVFSTETLQPAIVPIPPRHNLRAVLTIPNIMYYNIDTKHSDDYFLYLCTYISI